MSNYRIDAKARIKYKCEEFVLFQGHQIKETMRKLMTIAAAVALATIGHSVQATLIIDTGTGTLENSDNELLTVNYEVSYDSGSGKYTYDYNLEASAGLTSFTLSAYTPTVELGTDGIGALSALIYPNSIEWQWGATLFWPATFGYPECKLYL